MAVDEHNKARFDAAKADIKKAFGWILVFFVVTEVIFFLLNLYEATLGAPTLKGAPIAYKHLATEKSHPFPLYSGRESRVAHKSAIWKFPDVSSCLTWSEQFTKTPDLRNMSWWSLSTAEDADVCLFRIFSSIESVDDVIAWVGSLGLNITFRRKIRRQRMYRFDEKMPGMQLNMTWGLREKGPMFFAWGWRRVIVTLFAWGANTQMYFTQDSRVVRISSGFTFH